MEALGINIGYLIMQILGIIFLTLILRGLLYNPIINALESRKARIAKGLEDSRQAAIARDNAVADAKKILDEARAESAKIRSQAVADAEEQRKGIVATANDEARGVLLRANEEADDRRNQALGGLRGQVASIAMAAANKIVGEELDEKRQHAIINDFFSKVPEGVSGLSGINAVVTSALPLEKDEMAAAKKAIKADNVDFTVDPNILGGLIVRVDDQVFDDSVANQMGEMRGSLN